MQKENQRVALTKHLIRDALFRLLKEKSITKITIMELCKEAEINRATFYRHYTTPSDVLTEIENVIIEELLNLWIYEEEPIALKRNLGNICSYIYKHADLIKILMQCNRDQNLTHALYDLCQKLSRDLYFSEDISTNPDNFKLVSSCLGGGFIFFINLWLTEDIKKTPEEMAELLVNIIDKSIFLPQKKSNQ